MMEELKILIETAKKSTELGESMLVETREIKELMKTMEKTMREIRVRLVDKMP